MPLQINVPGSWRGVRNQYEAASQDLRDYFDPIAELLEHYAWEVSISYAFTRVEQAHNSMLYAGTVKLHRANPTVARRIADRQHITREGFKKLFKNVYGESVPKEALETLSEAEKIRDKIVHGKKVTGKEKREALVGVLAYAEYMNAFVNQKAAFMPFSTDRRGYTGNREALDESTTTWLMRGLGFDGKREVEGNQRAVD